MPTRRARGRRLGYGALVLGGIIVVGLGVAGLWVLANHDVDIAKTDVVAGRDGLTKVTRESDLLRTPAGRIEARSALQASRTKLARADRRLKRSLPLSLARFVPGLGRQRSGAVGLVQDMSVAAETGERFLADFEGLAARSVLRQGVIPFASLAEMRQRTEQTGRTLRSLIRSPSGLRAPLKDLRVKFNDLVTTTSQRLLQGGDTITAAGSFLGLQGDRRYFVALENNAEMRDRGLVLSYAIVRISGGRLSFERTGRIGDLRLDRPAPTPIPQATNTVFGFLRPTELWQSVNATADLAWTGRAVVDMAQQATGEAFDGVLFVDVPAVGRLLEVLGPVELPGLAAPLSGKNAERVLLKDLYEGVGPGDDKAVRVERQAEAFRTVADRLTTGDRDTFALGQELANAAAGSHLRVWSRASAEEASFERAGLAGGPALANPRRTFHLAVANRGANKLDYYVHPSIAQRVEIRGGAAIVRTTVTIDNTAPRGAKPSYAFGSEDGTSHPGDYLAWVLLWGPLGSSQGATVDESGLALSEQVVPVSAQERRDVEFTTVIPNAVTNGRLTLRFVPQPRVETVRLVVTMATPGWRVDGKPTWQGKLDRTRTLTLQRG